MKRLIILEGADGVGKSTQAQVISQVLGAQLIRQPNDVNLVGFLRDRVKNGEEYTAFERQLMHTISHIVDVYDSMDFNKFDLVVMDRSPISGLAYSRAMQMDSTHQQIIRHCNLAVYQKFVEVNNIQVYIFHLVLSSPTKLKDTPDDFYEKSSLFNLEEQYVEVLEQARNPHNHLFSPQEQIHRIDVSDKTRLRVMMEILSKIGEIYEVK